MSKAQGSQHCVVSRQKDMTRQYKGMQEELLNRVNTLENTITHLKDQLGTNILFSVWYYSFSYFETRRHIYLFHSMVIESSIYLAVVSHCNYPLPTLVELSRIALEETKREKDQIIAMKEAEIAEMKAKMEEMAHEFGDMLKVPPFSTSFYLRRTQGVVY